MKEKQERIPELINGRKVWFLVRRLRAFIFWQILKVNRNPLTAVREVKRLKKLRSSVHGNQRITKLVKSGSLYYWVTDFPGFPSANLKKVMQQEFFRNNRGNGSANRAMIPQQTIIWGITNRCQLQCSHCYDWDNIDSRDHLSLDQLKEILQKIEEQGIRHVQLSGGEPLTRFDDMISILKEASTRIDFWLLTSGFGLTEEKARALKKAGLVGANISLDHWDEDKHNRFRNHPRSFEWVLKAVENCRKAGILVSLSLCATREFTTEENLDKYIQLAKNIGAHFIRILEARQVGRFSDKPVRLGKDQIELISDFVIRMNNDPQFSDYPIVVFYGYHQRKLGCMGAGNRYLYIDANGDFHACPFCRGRRGNALTGSFNNSIEKLRSEGCQAFKTVSVGEEFEGI
ncbi:radical SAM protein [Maribellus sp. CM-23]|uniref:radical SAM/SPASM domain-containing protein n=1 Tax=Maribellus sp. CM-23 TaxID=2781026 RepID=UPI001F1F0BA8|nr:radical SAM protein [Maribellus sp. CM-23]MCE4564024.1 radical SAM protein [Maribellus sp. CM-23]